MQERLFAAHHDLEERHWWFRARRRALLALGAPLVPPGGHIVDAGCGTGADVSAFPAAYHRTGLDGSATAIAFARSRHRDVRFEVAVLPGAAADVIGRANLVLLCDVLEHVEADGAFLRWLIDAMQPGAHLILTVPADPRLWSPHDEVYGHHRRYTQETLAAAWAGSSVRVRLLVPFNRVLYPVARLARTVANRRGRGWGRGGGDLSLPWAPLNDLLERLFASEIPSLVAALRADAGCLPGRGVSLLAVLRKDGP
jgi:SAM-dependent methyltransferase